MERRQILSARKAWFWSPLWTKWETLLNIDKYDDIIQNQLMLGVIENVMNNKKDTTKHYIPHHAGINPDKTSTKVRVVYDAWAKINKGQKSQNEYLYPGPTILKDLNWILLRFRLNKIAVIADIEKTFLQIG